MQYKSTLIISGNSRDKCIRYLNNTYLDILNIYELTKYIDPNFKENITKNHLGRVYSNGERFGQYLDFNRYSYETFLKNTMYTRPLTIEFTLNEFFCGLLRLKGYNLDSAFERTNGMFKILKEDINKRFPFINIKEGISFYNSKVRKEIYTNVTEKVLNKK